MKHAMAVGRIKGIGDLRGKIEQNVHRQRATIDQRT
jgi:hypothetical protein